MCETLHRTGAARFLLYAPLIASSKKIDIKPRRLAETLHSLGTF